MDLATPTVKFVGSKELGARLRAARESRDLSLSRLSFALYDVEAASNYDPSFIGRVERGKPAPDRFIRLFGDLVQPSIDELPEYHLLKARDLFDEGVVGLEQALANLSHLSEALPIEGGAELLALGEKGRRLLETAPRSADRARQATKARKEGSGR